MDVILPVIVVIFVSVIASAFFSGMEIAFLSSNKLKLEIDRKQSRMFSSITGLFSRHPGQYITTLLVGNNIALVIYSLNMSVLIRYVMHLAGWTIGSSFFLETIIPTIIIIFLAEFIPKAVVKLNPNFYYRHFAVAVYVCYVVFYPISKFSTYLSFLILRLCGLQVRRDHVSSKFDRVDLANLLEEATENDDMVDKGNDIKLFQNALDFSDLRVRDCMVPRIEIEAIDINSGIGDLQKIFVDTSFSRILVYDGSIDNVVGYVNSKSLFTRPGSIREIVKEIDYVPETLPTQKMLSIFIRKRRSIAVVIDEFGGTAGMVTIEDVLEEIFGEIEDEYDSQDMLEKMISDKEYLLSGRLEVYYLNDKYNLDIPESDEYETLAGYIIYHYKDIPSQGENIVIDNKEIHIVRTSASKIELVRLKVI